MKALKKTLAITTFVLMSSLIPVSADYCRTNAYNCSAWCEVWGPSTDCWQGSNFASCTWYYANGAWGGNYYYTC